MATPTYTPIASITLGSSASSVTFSSIPQDYRDLVLAYDVDISSTGGSLAVRFNSDSGSNYSRVVMLGDGSSTSSSSPSGEVGLFVYSSPYEKYWGRTQIMDYTATDKHKTALFRTDNVGEQTVAGSGRWADTSAITTLEISTGGGSYEIGSTFALYGIVS